MDSITKTVQNAFVNYYNSLRRLGNISKQDKYKLLLVWFFYQLKYHDDFLKKPIFVKDDEGNDTNEIDTWVIDRQLESQINKTFMKNINCLMQNSCFIKLVGSYDCVPIINVNWTSEPVVQALKALVTNATAVIGNIPSNITDVQQLSQLLWTNGSAFIVNDDEELINPDIE